MNTDGHCRHCGPDHTGCYSNDAGGVHYSDLSNTEARMRWVDGCCPACAEADRIVDAIEEEEMRLFRIRHGTEWVTADYRAGMMHAARIARGVS